MEAAAHEFTSARHILDGLSFFQPLQALLQDGLILGIQGILGLYDMGIVGNADKILAKQRNQVARLGSGVQRLQGLRPFFQKIG